MRYTKSQVHPACRWYHPETVPSTPLLGIERMILRTLIAAWITLVTCCASSSTLLRHDRIPLAELRRLWVELSESEGYFDSDNFISNEAGYLSVLPSLERLQVRGGAYLGVGPDQNYSYIAQIQPEIVILMDIRRQNALQHFYYKALLQLSRDRREYLERLFGRPLHSTAQRKEAGSIFSLLKEVDAAPINEAFAREKVLEAQTLMRRWDLRLSSDDERTVQYLAQAFVRAGPEMRFTSYGRPPRSHHPTYRTLLTATDSLGKQANFLANSSRFRIVKDLHEKNRIIPVVGDLAGKQAMRNVAREIGRRGILLETLYVSNVEFYLFNTGRWARYLQNLRSLPMAPRAYVIRTFADRHGYHPAHIPGYYMTTILQPMKSFLDATRVGKILTYGDLLSIDCIFEETLPEAKPR